MQLRKSDSLVVYTVMQIRQFLPESGCMARREHFAARIHYPPRRLTPVFSGL